jgi:hypothetical protein
MRKNLASQVVGVQMTALDGSPFTGAATCYVLGDSGSLAAGSVSAGAATHKGGGWHDYAPSKAETNYSRAVYQFRGTGAITAAVQVYTNAGPQPRINRKQAPGFTTQVSGRSDGTYKCTKPIRLTAGAVEQVYVFIDMSPLFGNADFVETVGAISVSTGSIAEGSERGPRDIYAVVELDGTADDDCEVTVPVTMTSGTTVDVVFDVEILDD